MAVCALGTKVKTARNVSSVKCAKRSKRGLWYWSSLCTILRSYGGRRAWLYTWHLACPGEASKRKWNCCYICLPGPSEFSFILYWAPHEQAESYWKKNWHPPQDNGSGEDHQQPHCDGPGSSWSGLRVFLFATGALHAEMYGRASNATLPLETLSSLWMKMLHAIPGRVVEVEKDRRGHVRQVQIRTKTGFLDRPITKICLLQEAEDLWRAVGITN